jgi:hypothetical protein
MTNRVQSDVMVAALRKGIESYVFLYTHKTRAAMLRTFGRFAKDPGLSFNWYDAAVLSQRVRKSAAAEKIDPGGY